METPEESGIAPILCKILEFRFFHCKEEYIEQINDLYESGQYELLIQTMNEWSKENWNLIYNLKIND